MYTTRQKKAPIRRRKLPLVIVGIVVIAAALAAAGFMYVHHKDQNALRSVRPTNTVDYNPPTKEEKAEAEKQKEEIIQKQTDEDTGGTTTTNIQAQIVRASQASAGAALNVRVLVSGSTTGTCTLTLTRSGQSTITKTFPVAFEATTASCGAADIPASDISASGDWKLQVTVQNNDHTSPPVSQTVTITK